MKYNYIISGSLVIVRHHLSEFVLVRMKKKRQCFVKDSKRFIVILSKKKTKKKEFQIIVIYNLNHKFIPVTNFLLSFFLHNIKIHIKTYDLFLIFGVCLLQEKKTREKKNNYGKTRKRKRNENG